LKPNLVEKKGFNSLNIFIFYFFAHVLPKRFENNIKVTIYKNFPADRISFFRLLFFIIFIYFFVHVLHKRFEDNIKFTIYKHFPADRTSLFSIFIFPFSLGVLLIIFLINHYNRVSD